MQQPSDVACNMASVAMRNASRAAEFFIDAHVELSRFRLKIAEAALEDVREMEHTLAAPADWTSLAAAQSMFMKMQSSHSANALRSWIDFANNLQAAYLRQLTEWNDQMQRPEGQTSSSQLFVASADSLKTFFDSLNVLATNSKAKTKAAPRPATEAQAEHAV